MFDMIAVVCNFWQEIMKPWKFYTCHSLALTNRTNSKVSVMMFDVFLILSLSESEPAQTTTFYQKKI
jgi:hypothetical protein